MKIICPSCASDKVSYIGEIPSTDIFAQRMLPEPLNGGYLYKCISCYLHFRYPRLTKQQLDKLYQKGYKEKIPSMPTYRQDWKIANNWIRSHFNQGKVLDVGCFDGGFLALLDHTQYQRYGIEINQAASQRAQEKGIYLISHNFDDLETLPIKFNAVVAIDVIEHVLDPLQFLISLAKLTLSKGMIIISTANTESLSWRFMRSRYWYCTIAEHISFINPQWCYNAATKCNLVVECTENFSHSNSNRKKQILELGKNILYRFTPTTASWLRKKGFGGKKVDKCNELSFHPPSWM